MKSVRLVLVPLIILSACQSSDPIERQADGYEAAGRNAADAIKAESALRATAMENQASMIERDAGAAGGYTEKKLDVRADALRREAEIIKDQGEARADAVRADASAKATDLRSR